MPPRRAHVRRNLNVEQNTPQALIDPLVEQVTHDEFKTVFQMLAQAITAQANREVVSLMNPIMGTAMARVQDYTQINPQ